MSKWCWKCKEWKADEEFAKLVKDDTNFRYWHCRRKQRPRCRQCRCHCTMILKGACMKCGKPEQII